MIAGLTAGSIAAVVAALVSLPLRSPDDALLNSATVVIAALIAGLAAGALWRYSARSKRHRTVFAGVWTAAFGAAALLSWAGETQLDRFLPFALPLAAIVFTLTGALTVLLWPAHPPSKSRLAARRGARRRARGRTVPRRSGRRGERTPGASPARRPRRTGERTQLTHDGGRSS